MGNKGSLFRLTRKKDGKSVILSNFELFKFIMEITCNDPNIAYSGEIKRKYLIERIENPTDAEWLLYGEKK